MLFRAISYVVLFCALVISNCYAIEIKNTTVITEGNLLTIQYDLIGKPGEKQAVVKAAISMNGERYYPGVINLTGDYGSGVKVGLHKKITWNILNDMPAGYEGTIICELDALSDGVPDPFKLLGKKAKIKSPVISDYSIGDPNTGLMWFKFTNKLQKVNNIDDANLLIGKMNKSNYRGFSDWRLPSKDEWESLIKLLTAYGYESGQAMYPYLSKIGFSVVNEPIFWTKDKSSMEFTGKDVIISGSGQYSAGSSSNSNYGSGKYSQRSTSSSSGTTIAYSGSGSVKTRAADAGLDNVLIKTKDGYFYKQQPSESAYVLPVRGDKSSEIFAVSIDHQVKITPN